MFKRTWEHSLTNRWRTPLKIPGHVFSLAAALLQLPGLKSTWGGEPADAVGNLESSSQDLAGGERCGFPEPQVGSSPSRSAFQERDPLRRAERGERASSTPKAVTGIRPWGKKAVSPQNSPWIRNTIPASPRTPPIYQSHFLRVRTDIADIAMAI